LLLAFGPRPQVVLPAAGLRLPVDLLVVVHLQRLVRGGRGWFVVGLSSVVAATIKRVGRVVR
jgi:hypothetical protein